MGDYAVRAVFEGPEHDGRIPFSRFEVADISRIIAPGGRLSNILTRRGFAYSTRQEAQRCADTDPGTVTETTRHHFDLYVKCDRRT
jgi:hypothetical protein